MNKHYYFDNAATTAADTQVIKAMSKYWSEDFGNASSVHWYGQRAKAAVEQARQIIADYLFVQPAEIVFTSGATEGDNLAIKGIVEFYQQLWLAQKIKKAPHLITTYLEHPAVLESCLRMEKKGCQLSIVQPNSSGLVIVDDLLSKIQDNTILISVMYVNNEVGTIQPVAEIGKRLLTINAERLQKKLPKIYFHIDAVQALNYCNCRPKHVEADLMTFSGHKIYGPKGVGFNFVKEKTPLIRQQDGGSQEKVMRAGTYNSSGIVGLGQAVHLLAQQQTKRLEQARRWQKKLFTFLSKYPQITYNGSRTLCIPSIANISFKHLLAEDLVIKLDLMGVAISAGSACAAGAIKISPVLKAMGLDDDQARRSIRLSWGKDTKINDFNYLLKCLTRIIKDDQTTQK